MKTKLLFQLFAATSIFWSVSSCYALVEQVSTNHDPGAGSVECIAQLGNGQVDQVQQLVNTVRNVYLARHPDDGKILVAAMNQDVQMPAYFSPYDTFACEFCLPVNPAPCIDEQPGGGIPFFKTGILNTVAFSHDGGKTWSHTFIPSNVCSGGTLSDTAELNALKFSAFGGPTGRVYLLGSYNDYRSFDDRLFAQSGMWVTKSQDGGASWDQPKILLTGVSAPNFCANIAGPTYTNASGNRVVGSSLLPDPFKPKNVYVAGETISFPTGLYGSIFFTRSTDGGDTWEDARQIYDLTTDPTYVSNPLLPPGGESGFPDLAAVKRGGGQPEVLVAAFMRLYPKPSPFDSYTQTPDDSLFDRVSIRSFDGGKSWEKSAKLIFPFTFAESSDPRCQVSPMVFAIDDSFGTHLAVDHERKIIYALGQGNLDTLNGDVSQLHPQIIVSASRTFGDTWTIGAEVSRTSSKVADPTSPANQAFNGNIAIAKNGMVGIIYDDFRYFDTSCTSTCDQTCPVQTNVWLAIYRPTHNIDGGSTGIGLDFVKEISLAAFDAAPAFNAYFTGQSSLVDGVGNHSDIVARGKGFFTAFTEAFPSNPNQLFFLPDDSADFLDTNALLKAFVRLDKGVATESSSSQSSSSSSCR